MQLLFLGKPGAGKGTQTKMLIDLLNVPHISTGDMFREHLKNETELGKKAKGFMDSGELVPDEVVIDMVKVRLSQDDCSQGFILDGFPRTEAQAEALDALLSELGKPLQKVLNLTVDDETVVSRLLKRAELEGRSDDNEEAIQNRLNEYNAKTKPLIDFYTTKGLLVTVDGIGSVEEIFDNVKKALDM